MEDSGEINQPSERNIGTEKALADVDRIFGERGINYLTIGSVARVAYSKKGVPSNDIDILIPDKSQRQEAEAVIKELSPAHPNIYLDTSLSNLLEKDETGRFHLKYGKIDFDLDPKLFEKQRLDLNGIEFNTVPPATLLHMYTLVGGPFREKDWHNALDFGRWLKTQESYDHKEYQSFHKFGQRRWKGSPLRKIQYSWRSFVNALPSPLRKGLLTTLYQLPVTVYARDLFNSMEETFCGGSQKFMRTEADAETVTEPSSQ